RQHNKEKRAALKKFEERIQSVSDGLRTDWVKKLEEQIEKKYTVIEAVFRDNEIKFTKLMAVFRKFEEKYKKEIQEFTDSKGWGNITVDEVSLKSNNLREEVLERFQHEIKQIADGSLEGWRSCIDGKLLSAYNEIEEGVRKLEKKRKKICWKAVLICMILATAGLLWLVGIPSTPLIISVCIILVSVVKGSEQA
ncbi:unnamed protein product, partial [Enterobius vermicularis]|uniref:Conjugal transfer protein n=1 Tax=Enterobius vermicularis TaxID=51028 RepID=A0A0N4UTT9_ENTVE